MMKWVPGQDAYSYLKDGYQTLAIEQVDGLGLYQDISTSDINEALAVHKTKIGGAYVLNWLDSETKLLTQFARAGGANPEEKNIAYNIADFGFKLGPNKPAAATLCLPNNTFIPLNGRTRRKIITSNYKKITNFITVLYRIKDKYVEADGTLSKQAQSDISIFGVSSNTSEDPQGTTTTADVTREVMLAIKNEWISKDKDSISARVNKLCGKGVFRQETRDKLTQIIYNRFTDEDKVLPWSEAAVKVWREENKFKDADWKEPKKVGNKEVRWHYICYRVFLNFGKISR